MADQETIVLDISSDEDVGWGDSMAKACGGEDGGGGRDDGEWISELLDKVHKETDDPDEVEVVGEVIAKPKSKVTKSLVNCINKIDDDECVILDGDPDKPIAIENDKGEDDSDELFVVSEKGQVACRDYPHARHLCVKFPFNSTPHDSHCDQCHCYVCDSLAPCLHWSTGISSIDHCHATDKDEFWNAQRKSSKKNDKVPPVASEVPDAFFTGLPPLLHSDHSLQNQLLFTPAAHQLSSMPTCNGATNIVTHGRSQHSGSHTRNKYRPHFIAQRLRSTYSNVIPGDRRHHVGNPGMHFISRVPLKRTASLGGVLPTNRYCNNSSRISNEYQFPRSHPPAARRLDSAGGATSVMNMYQDSSKANVGGMATSLMSDLPAMTNTANRTANYTSSQPQMFPQARRSSVNANTVGPQNQLSSWIYADFNFTNPMPTQPGVATQPNWDCPFENSFCFQPQATSNDTRVSQDPVPFEPLLTSLGNISNCFESAVPTQPNADSGFENSLPHQAHACGQPAFVSNTGEDTSEQGNRTQSTLRPSSAEFDFGWDSPTSHSIQPLHVEYNQLENAVQGDEPAVTVDGGSEIPGSTYPSLLDLQFDSWTFEDQSALGALEVPVPPELNVFSPEAVHTDVDLLFD